jgi:hypothetical protein
MATVPTLIVGAVDQTDSIQHKTLGFRLKTLDFTLVDPATTPALHDTVSLDEPTWHGRVSTVESFPYRTAGGDDHRLVKVTATNKLVAPDDTAPFGLSDAPDLSTTYPYKDLVVIRTLADQTDLATAELRVHATIYQPGIVPGMTVEVTNAAESLTAEPVIVTEMTVSWLRDDAPEFRLESSDTGVPPVTLGGLIDDAGCDCGVFECVEPDWQVYTYDGGGGMLCGIPYPENTCNTNGDPGNMVHLWAGATYRVQHTVFHWGATSHMQAMLASDAGSGTTVAITDMGSAGDPGTWGPPQTYAVVNVTIATTGDYYTRLYGAGGAFTVDYYSSISSTVWYVSGADPRFETSPPCLPPHSGQLVIDPDSTGDGTTTDFTTAYPYGPGSLEVFVNGLDWTATLTESDPAAGDYGTAYPYPAGATVSVRYRGA